MAKATTPRVSLLARLAKIESVNSDSPKATKHKALSDLERDLKFAKDNKLPDVAKKIRNRMRKAGYYRSESGAYPVGKTTNAKRTTKGERTEKASADIVKDNTDTTNANA